MGPTGMEWIEMKNEFEAHGDGVDNNKAVNGDEKRGGGGCQSVLQYKPK